MRRKNPRLPRPGTKAYARMQASRKRRKNPLGLPWWVVAGGAALGLYLLTRSKKASAATPMPGDLVQITKNPLPGETVQITPKSDADLPAFTMEDLEGTGGYGRYGRF